VTIDVLPDLALLEIFDFYEDDVRDVVDLYHKDIEAWHTLVHVCRKWRNIGFGSPRQLRLRLYCRDGTPVKKLAAWPRLPIVVWGACEKEWAADNIVAALEHTDRICQVYLGDILNVKNQMPNFKKVLAAMQQPFPALTDLYLRCINSDAAVPASLLGGSAPGLRSFWLERIPFPGFPPRRWSVASPG
jgi:hypothetical protein